MAPKLIKQIVYSETELEEARILNDVILQKKEKIEKKIESFVNGNTQLKNEYNILIKKLKELSDDGFNLEKKYLSKISFKRNLTFRELKKRYGFFITKNFDEEYLLLEKSPFKITKNIRDIYEKIYFLKNEIDNYDNVDYHFNLACYDDFFELDSIISKNHLVNVNKNQISINIAFCNDYNRFSDFYKLQEISPVNIDCYYDDGCFYFYKNNLFYFDKFDIHTEEQKEILVKTYYYKKISKFESLKNGVSLFEKMADSEEKFIKREPIPENVRFSVWRRDQGICVLCGSNENLEYDHIIPFSRGGSNSERNLQLLCQSCNRSKSNKI